MSRCSIVLLSLLAACANTEPLEPGVTMFRLQHQCASEVAPILEDVLQSRGSCVRSPVQEQLVTPVRAEHPAQLQVRTDPAHNALLLRGTSEQVNEALALARRLDVPDVRAAGAR